MTGILNKARTLVLANIHNLLNKAIEMNSVEALKVYVRDLQDGRNDIREAVAMSHGSIRVIKQDIQNLEAKIEATEKSIKVVLSDGDTSNDRVATNLAVNLVGYKKTLEARKQELESAQSEAAALEKPLSIVETKLREVVNQISRLESLERATKAKEKAVGALEKAEDIVGAAGSVDVDNITRKLQTRAAATDVKLERALEGIEESTTSLEAEVELARIKQDLANKDKEAEQASSFH